MGKSSKKKPRKSSKKKSSKKKQRNITTHITTRDIDFESKPIKIENHYKIITEIGSGSFGIVLKVKDSSGKIYALKLLHQKYKVYDEEMEKKMVIEEFKALKSIGDKCKQGLVCYYKLFYGLYNGHKFMCILMDYVEDSFSLTKENCRKISLKQMIKYVYQVVKTVKTLLDRGIIHRDIKQNNIVFTKEKAVLIDYGFMCRFNNCLGNPQEAPELLEKSKSGTIYSKKNISVAERKSSAIYSLGLTIYNMLARCAVDDNTLKRKMPELYKFIQSMYEEDVKKRPTIEQVENMFSQVKE